MLNSPVSSTVRDLIARATRPSLADTLWAEGVTAPDADQKALLDALQNWATPAVLTDGVGEVLYLDDAAVVLTGYDVADMTYHAPLSTWLWRHERQHHVAPGGICSSGRVWRGTTSLIAADGCTVVAECAVYPLCDDADDLVAMLIVLENRSEEIQRLRLAAMSTVSGRLAHDLNNLLTVQVAYCQMLVEDLDPDSEARNEATQVLRSVRRLMDLSHKLMLSSGRVTPGLAEVDLGELAQAMGEDLADLAPPSVETAISVAPGPKRVRANAEDVDAMLGALVQNALEAVGLEGSLAVTVRSIALAEPEGDLAPGDYVLVAVSDSGPGVSADQRNHLFEPLYAHKRGGVGTGLGLAMARGVAIAHGGLLRLAENPLGQGARFEVLLPSA